MGKQRGTLTVNLVGALWDVTVASAKIVTYRDRMNAKRTMGVGEHTYWVRKAKGKGRAVYECVPSEMIKALTKAVDAVIHELGG